jgi:TetR/AcrR family transcriptional regulator, regulator of cefoperazone and chloramphenicol sensitivity
VRDLAAAAGVNLAAVNYYFGSKEKLWLEVLRYVYRYTEAMLADMRGYLESATKKGTVGAAETAMRQCLHRILQEFLQEGHANGRLLTWEVMSPTDALEVVVRDFLAPPRRILLELMRILLPGETETELNLYVNSVVGQCVFARNTLPLSKGLIGRAPTPEFQKALAGHTVEFSLAAIRERRRRGGENS